MKIDFTESIERGDSTSYKFRAVEAFDDYFNLDGRKFTIIDPFQLTVKINDSPKRNDLLDIIKIISYFSLVIPIIMFVGKLIARSYYPFIYEVEVKKVIDELKVVFENKQTKNKRLVKIQSAARGLLARKTYQEERAKLKKKLFRSQRSIHELHTTEKSFLDSLISSLNLMQHNEFEACLKDINDKQQLNKFCDEYLHLITKNVKLVDSLEQIGKLENSLEIESDIKHVIRIFSGNDFEEYMRDLVKISRFQNEFEKLIDKDKSDALARQSGVQIFEPCFISIQRLMRYPMMLENTLQLLSKIDLPEYEEELRCVINKAKSLIKSYNLKVKIDELRGYIERYQQIQEKKNRYIRKINIIKGAALKELITEIDSYLSFNKDNLITGKLLPPDTSEATLQSLQLQLIEISEKHRNPLAIFYN